MRANYSTRATIRIATTSRLLRTGKIAPSGRCSTTFNSSPGRGGFKQATSNSSANSDQKRATRPSPRVEPHPSASVETTYSEHASDLMTRLVYPALNQQNLEDGHGFCFNWTTPKGSYYMVHPGLLEPEGSKPQLSNVWKENETDARLHFYPASASVDLSQLSPETSGGSGTRRTLFRKDGTSLRWSLKEASYCAARVLFGRSADTPTGQRKSGLRATGL